MASVEQELWNVFTHYTLHGNPLDPEHMRTQQFVKFCRACQIVGSSMSEAREPLGDADIVVMYTAEVKRKRAGKTTRAAQKMDFSDFLTALMKLSVKVYPREARASVDAAFQKMLLENVLQYADRRNPGKTDLSEHHDDPELAALHEIFAGALEQIFQFYATGSEVRSGPRARAAGGSPSRGSPSRTSRSHMSTTSVPSASHMGRASNSMKNALAYSGFLKFASDFGLSNTAILSTLELGDIYLSSLREIDSDEHIRKLTFDEFWEALVRCAITAYDKISRSSVADKLKGLFHYMCRAINRSVPRAVTGRSVSTYAGDLIAGAMLFNKRFTALWHEDNYREYLSPEAPPAETGRSVLRRIMKTGGATSTDLSASSMHGIGYADGGAAAASASSGYPYMGSPGLDDGAYGDDTGPGVAPGAAPQPHEDADYGASPAGRAGAGRSYEASRAAAAGLEMPSAAAAGLSPDRDIYRLAAGHRAGDAPPPGPPGAMGRAPGHSWAH